VLATLRRRDFALLWSAGLISLTGDWLLLIALPIYVYTLTRSAAVTSTVFLAEFVPPVLLGSVAGVFVDRWDRRRTMVIASLLQALVLLPLLAVHAPDRLWIVYVVSAAESVLAQFFAPAEQALLPRLVGAEHLVAANALAALNNNVARLVGAPLGGLVAGLLGLNGTVLLDATSFLLAGLLIGAITAVTRALEQATTAMAVVTTAVWVTVWRDWLAGLRVVRRSATVSTLFVLMVAQSVAQGLFVVLFVVFVSRVLHGGAAEMGWLRGVQAIGGLLGGVAVGAVGRRLPVARLIGLGAILFGLIDLAIWNAPTVAPAYALAVAIALFALVGLPGRGYLTGMTTLLQESVADAYRGRVFGAYATTSALAQLGGMALAGALGDRLGVLPLLNVQASVYLVAGVLALVLLRGATTGAPSAHEASEYEEEEGA